MDGHRVEPLYLGTHLSIGKGFQAVGETALSIGANTFSLFLRNPRGGSAKALDPEDIQALDAFLRERAFGPIVAHAPYTMNLASEKEEGRSFSAQMLAEDLTRMEYLPGNYYNLHPGTYHPADASEDAQQIGIERVAEMLNAVLQEGMHTMVLLETMAGEKEVGGRFEHLADILARVSLKSHVGVCLDTCHVYAAGYDLRNDLDGVLRAFDEHIGLVNLRAVHLNDSVYPLGSHRDRHAAIGQGEIGLEALIRFMRHPALRGIPFVTETHGTLGEHLQEISMIRKAYGDARLQA